MGCWSCATNLITLPDMFVRQLERNKISRNELIYPFRKANKLILVGQKALENLMSVWYRLKNLNLPMRFFDFVKGGLEIGGAVGFCLLFSIKDLM